VPICAHELAHLKRGDNWRLLFEHLLGGLFWMVPPFAAAARPRRRRARGTGRRHGAGRRRHRAPPGYAETLIDVLRTRAAPALQPAFTGKGRRPTLMRLKAITDPRDPATFARKALLGLAGLLAMAWPPAARSPWPSQATAAVTAAAARRSSHDKTGQYVDIRSDYVR
jgi:beta-lactamase regulating signal transducer with metallopeptidase domain